MRDIIILALIIIVLINMKRSTMFIKYDSAIHHPAYF
jgi:hypothetical protein